MEQYRENAESEALNPKQYLNPNNQNPKRFRTLEFRVRIFLLYICALSVAKNNGVIWKY